MKLLTTGLMISLTTMVAARADVVLDQQHSFASSIANSTNGDVTQVGQTFTVGVAGTLDHIDVFMFRLGGIFDPIGDPQLRLYHVAGGLPTGSPLATVTIPESNVPFNNAAFVSFGVSSAAIDVNVGDSLAWSVIATAGVGPYFVPTDQGQILEYSGGDAVINYGVAWQYISPPQDHSFRTFVNAASAPETTADFDEDGDVDGADFLIWQRGVGATTGATRTDGNANPDEDGDVDGDDLAVWESQFSGASTPTAVAVPEPQTIVLAALAITPAAVRRWRRPRRN